MKTPLFLLFFPCLLLLASCNLDEEIKTPDVPTLPDPVPCTAEKGIQPVIFNSLAVGQKSRFVFFSGDNYHDSTDLSIQYHPDTLVMEIIEIDGNGFRVKECITEGSQGHPDVLFPDSVLYYYIKVENGYLRPRRSPENTFSGVYSRLFITREIPLPLANIESQEMQLVGWKTSPANFGLYREGFCENCELNGTVFPYLNFILDNTDMTFDGHGTTWVYALNAGLVRAFYVSAWTGSGRGWDVLPD